MLPKIHSAAKFRSDAEKVPLVTFHSSCSMQYTGVWLFITSMHWPDNLLLDQTKLGFYKRGQIAYGALIRLLQRSWHFHILNAPYIVTLALLVENIA